MLLNDATVIRLHDPLLLKKRTSVIVMIKSQLHCPFSTSSQWCHPCDFDNLGSGVREEKKKPHLLECIFFLLLGHHQPDRSTTNRLLRSMSLYNFKKIEPVPTASDFIDIILSKTQRKTPTVIHKNYKISRIRQFYMRKVKFTQDNFEEKFKNILDEFPKLDVSKERIG